uniref:Non-specific serine/threonine protein kinase n=1 Tax=Panagrolaimus sp. JU765 TaxID=591449 RepID=A0AC34R4Y1_9BILA
MTEVELQEIISKLGRNEYRRINEKYGKVERAKFLFEVAEIRERFIADEEAWPEAFLFLSKAVALECDDNVGRQAEKKKATSFKYAILFLYRDMIRAQLKVLSPSVDLNCLIEGLLSCFQKTMALKALDVSTNEAWITTLELICDSLKHYPSSDLSFFNLKSLWKNCVLYLEPAVKIQEQKHERAKLTSILFHLVKHLHETHYFCNMTEVIAKVGHIVKDYKWSSKDPTRTVLLSVVNSLIKNNAGRHRHLLLQTFFSLAEEQACDLRLSSSSGKLSHISPTKEAKEELIEDEECSYSGSLYHFIENIVVLGYPDCELIEDTDLSVLIQQCCQILFDQLEDHIKKQAHAKKNFVVLKGEVRLLARLFLLSHILNTSDSDDVAQSAKRRKKTSYLFECAREAGYAHLQILEEILTHWEHRIMAHDLDEIAKSLATLDKKAIKRDDKLDLYMKTSAVLLKKKRDLTVSAYEELWNWGISTIQMPATHASACELLCSIMPYFTEMSSTKPLHLFRSVLFQMAQFSSYRQSTIKLFHTTLHTFEFDERSIFRVDQSSFDEWCFRSQLLLAVLEYSVAKPSETVELIKAILAYHPKEVSWKKSSIAVGPGFETILKEQFCSVKIQDDVCSDGFSPVDDSVPLLVIRLVEFLNELWEQNAECLEKRIWLWKVCLLTSQIYTCSVELDNLLDNFESYLVVELDEADDEGKVKILQNLDIGPLWFRTKEQLRRAVNILADSGFEICWKFKLFWDSEVPLSKELLEDENVVKSGNLDAVFIHNLDQLSIADLLLILKKFGSHLKPETNLKIIQKTFVEIDADYQAHSNPDIIKGFKEQLGHVVSNNVDLFAVDFLKIRNNLLNCMEAPGFELAKMPIYFLEETFLESCLEKVDKFIFVQIFLKVLNSFKSHGIPEVLLKWLLKHRYGFLKKYVQHFDEYVDFHKPLLEYFALISENVRSDWRKLLNTKNPIAQLLNGKSVVIDETLSPDIFCLPYKFIKKLYEMESFGIQWMKWETDSLTYHQVFRSLRILLFKLRKSSSYLKINYPFVILRNVFFMVNSNKNGYQYMPDDIVSLTTCLIQDAMTLCDDELLKKLVVRFLRLLDDDILPVFKSAVLVDILKEFSSTFPKTCELLQSIKIPDADSAENGQPSIIFLKRYTDFVFSDYATEPPSFLMDGVDSMINGDYEVSDYQTQLFGFWELIRRHLENQLDNNAFGYLIPFWMFFPRLRPVLTRILVLFSSETVDAVLKDHRYFVSVFTKQENFNFLVVTLTPMLLYDSTIIHEPSILESLYDLVMGMTTSKSSSQSTYEFDIDPFNHCGLILFNLIDYVPQKSWRDKFLIVAYQMPVYASLALLRIASSLDAHGQTTLMTLINTTLDTLLLEDREKSRCLSGHSHAAPFTFNVSQSIPLPLSRSLSSLSSSANVFDSESAMLFLYIVVSIVELPNVDTQLLDLKMLCQCLTKAQMFNEAYFLLKRLLDNLRNLQRWDFMFKHSGSLLEVVMDDELQNLTLDILIGLKNPLTVRQLPLKIKTVNRARLFLAECHQDWGAMASICNSNKDRDKQAKALMFLGSLPSDCSRDVFYELSTKMAVFDNLNISFPKESSALWEHLCAIIKRHNENRPYKKWKFLDETLLEISKKGIVDSTKLDECRHLMLIQELTVKKKSKIPDGALRCSFHLANLSKRNNHLLNEEFEDAIEAIVQRTKSLRNAGAPLCSVKLLDTFDFHVKKCVFPETLNETFLERAKILDVIGERDVAIFSLTLLKDRKRPTTKEQLILSRASKLLAKLQVDMKESHLQAAVAMSKESGRELYCKNLVKLGLFLETKYQDYQDYMESPAFQLKLDCIKEIKIDNPSKGRTQEEKKEQFVLNAEATIEKNDVRDIQNKRSDFLHKSVRHYINAITSGSDDATLIYRVVALLIKNPIDGTLMALVENCLDLIPSNVWLTVINLLSSHLFSDNAFSKLVEKISIAVITDYPFQSVNTFLFYGNDKKRREKIDQLFSSIKNKKSSRIIKEMTGAHRCFVELGITDIDDDEYFNYLSAKGKVYEMKSSLKLMKHKESLKTIPLPTIPQKNIFAPGDERNYDPVNFITIKDVESKVKLADGNSSPKIVNFLGSDDELYTVLFKNEDLKQDSLIQQLFSLNNSIMSQKPACPKSFNPLTTYNVLPLTPECGLIEYCQNTQSLAEYLIGPDKNSGAHAQYRPQDMRAADARTHLAELQKGGSLRSGFLQLCEKIQPVFRYYFYTNFKTAHDFHAAIDRYTQSLAQWSIVCYIVGLGDRHLTNIRIDTNGNLVHIDLGMVFEYSRRVLPIPEKVPFRMTRDLVDPLLIDGINGELRRIAIHTLQQLRDNCEVIVGVASTLIHDPVSTFAAKCQKAGSDNNRHFAAETAISRLKEKLAGRGLSMHVMTAEQQVDKLFQEATDVDNLSRVFIGWMPFI